MIDYSTNDNNVVLQTNFDPARTLKIALFHAKLICIFKTVAKISGPPFYASNYTDLQMYMTFMALAI